MSYHATTRLDAPFRKLPGSVRAPLVRPPAAASRSSAMRLPASHGVPADAQASFGGFGRAMLEKLGWSSGKGLGKNEDGMAEALKPKKKEDNSGVGGSSCRPWSEKQWERSFAAALSRLPGDGDSPSDADSDSDSDSQAPAPEQPDTTGLGCSGRVGRDGIATTGTAQELALARTLAKDKWGRWGGRDGKMARIAAAEAQHAASAGAAATGAKAGKRSRAQAEAAEAEAADARERAAKRAREEAAAPAIASASRAAVTAVSSFWWSAVFRFAGALEGAMQERIPPPPAVFAGTEAEQEAMALAAERNKSSGRKGLGRGKRGVEDEWTGTRKTFVEEEEEGQPEQQAQVEAPASEADAAVSRLKWKKLASKVLAAAPGGLLSERKLRRATVRAALAVLGAGCEHKEEALTRAFDQRVLASSKFCRAPCGRLQLAGGDEQGE